MSDSRRLLLGNTLYASVGLYADYAAALIVSIVIARHLGPERFGTYTLLIWFATAGVVFSNNGITTGVMKFVGEARGQGAPTLARGALRYLERMQLWSALAVCTALGVFIVALADRVVADAEARRLLWVLVPAVMLRSLYVFWLSAAKGFENFKLTAQVQGFVAPVSLLIVLAVAYRGAALEQFVYAYALVALLYATVMGIALFRALPPTTHAPGHDAPASRIRRHVVYASAIVTFELLVLRQTELLFLDHYSTPASVAWYSVGRALSASAMLLVPGVATTLLLPMMSRTFGSDPGLLGRRFLAATRYILILAVPVVALCEVFAADVITIFYGSAYGPAVMVFRITVAAAAVGVVSASASSYQLGTDRQPAIVGIMAAVAALTLGLDWMLIRAYELRGATAAGAAGSVLLGAGLLWHAARTLRVTLDSSTYLRIVVAGALSAVPAMIARAALPVWLALPVGVILLVAFYLVLTLALGGWTRADVRSMRALADAAPPRMRRPIGALLERAATTTTLVPKEV